MTRRLFATILVCFVTSACTSAEPSPSTTSVVTTAATSSIARPEVDPYNWSLDEIVDGRDLAWELAFDADLAPLGFETVDDAVFFMATSRRDGGLWVWSTVDGVTWRDHGEVVPSGEMVGAVGSTGSELLAVTEEGPGQGSQLLRSRDGATWSRDEMHSDPDNPLLVFRPTVVGGSDDLTVVGACDVFDARGFIVERFGDRLPAGVDTTLLGVSWEQSGEDLVLRITVPPGLPVAEATGNELGLTDQERSWFTENRGSSRFTIWSQPTGGSWQSGVFEGSNGATSVFSSPTGEVLLTTGDQDPSTGLYRTFDGLLWDSIYSEERPLSASVWDETRVGPSATGGESDFLVSSDGIEWDRTNLSSRFPIAPVFTVTHTAAGGAGYLATVESFDWSYSDPPTDAHDSAILEMDELTIRISDLIFGPSGLIDGPHDIAVYESGASDALLYPIAGTLDREDLSIDIDTQTITFRDEGGQDLVSVTFEEMGDLLYRTLAPARLFSRNGLEGVRSPTSH